MPVSGLYLDDQTSGWSAYNNTFVDMAMGVLLGGGKQNSFHDNYYEDCDIAVHFDNVSCANSPSICVRSCRRSD